MNQFDVVQGFLERGETGSPLTDRLAAAFLKAIQSLGFRHFACCSHVDPLRPPREAIMMHNYPRSWMRTYSEAKLYEIDPVLKRAETHPLPFFWDSAFQSAAITKSQKIILADAAGYGLIHGYTVPLCLSWQPGALRASCSVIPESTALDPRNYLAIEVMAAYLYFFASRTQPPLFTAARAELTQRERQCLMLVAQGKGDWTIGRVLGLSESTVHYHIEQLKRRLRVATRMQAVVEAFMTGQLSFSDVRSECTNIRMERAPSAH